MGVTMRELIEEHAGGMKNGFKFKGALARRRFYRFS